ncbi:SSS family solute:Na+ symporter [Povalibacter uvarum]|uniref:SSS family solute:Na+ symporter n=1 Tax=Povalibacter uvarum TaxID=732238 RepID=A0A841HQD0_9GAMM|nr:sodium:solute symporter [Povalibacter uvarum]MBB6095417.1 SSS family solute:Na+ symporter [Povalibacter uvarum]
MTGTAVSFSGLDWAVVALYFVVNTAICVWCAMQKEKNTEDYFLAGRTAGWVLIGSSIFASNIGAEHLIGLAGSGADSGVAFAHWELHSYLVLVLGWIFAPFYLRAKIFTTPEFLEKRYTPATRTVLSVIFLVSYILTKASVTIFAGAFAIQTILGYDQVNVPLLGQVDFFWFAAFSLVIITGVFVILGGMKSVLYTEAMHVPVLLAGSTVLLFVGLGEIGGMDALLAANPDTSHLWRPLSTTPETQGFPGFLFDPSATPWLGVLLCSPIIGLWYWCTDQYIVQRVLTGKSLKESRRGTIFAAYLKLTPLFIFLLPGMIAVALYKQGAPGFETIGDNPQGAFPVLVSSLLPVGLRGLVLAGMLSALMSALASLFNSTATLFTVDFYKRLRPQSSEKHLVNVGRIATAGVIVLGMLWIPFLQDLGKGQLYTYLQLVQSLLAPSIAAVFMLGIFSNGVTPKSGLIGIVTGFVLGMLRLVFQATHEMYGVEWPGFIQTLVDINWLYFSFMLFVFTCVVIFAVSAVTPKAPPEQIAGITYNTATAEQIAEEKDGYGFWEIFHTVVIVAIIASIYIYFW